MFDDILPKRKGFYEEMKEKLAEIPPSEPDSFDELIDMIKELTEEIKQAGIDV